VLVDPLEPPREVRRAEHVLITVYWHGRSTKDVQTKHVWTPARSAQPLRNLLVSHGEPVLSAGRQALAGVLAEVSAA
jgi:hypothetical protein